MKQTTVMALHAGWTRLIVWDTALLIAAARHERVGLRRAMRALTRAGDPAGWIVHGLVLGVWIADGAAVLALACAVAAATLVAQILKRSCCRTRPDHAIAGFVAGAANPDLFSFPSGHSAVAFAAATSLAAVDPLLGALETALATAIALSRVGLGAHYPLDVVAGSVLGAGCAMTTAAVLARIAA